ncbi:PASTA domain-containing protein [Candidatus Saganbacteria bacterium]|nr:PASTA domain-containing protein [Candidatus Saganbacteria bacterium]
MLVEYLTVYLIFIIFMSLLAGVFAFRARSFRPQILLPLLLVLIVLSAIAVYFYSIYFNSIPEVIVPDLTGTRLETALAKLDELKLHSRHAGTVYDMKYPEGVLVSQRPEPGRRVKLGRTVSVLTSSGRRRVVVPNLLGRSLNQAAAALEAQGLLLGRVEQDQVMGIDSGIVLTQSPLPGEAVDVGVSVDLTVSASEEQ